MPDQPAQPHEPGPPDAHPVVVHAIGRAAWAAAGDDVRPQSLSAEGFVHLSRPDQIAGVCTSLYAGRDDLVLLVVDPARLPAPLVWEDCYATGQDFPHLYAALPRDAVIDVLEYPPGRDGRFRTPPL